MTGNISTRMNHARLSPDAKQRVRPKPHPLNTVASFVLDPEGSGN